jgi:hypothetical protein
MEKIVPWVADNGLRVESRTFHSISLTWSTRKDEDDFGDGSDSVSKFCTPRPLSTVSGTKSMNSMIASDTKLDGNNSSLAMLQDFGRLSFESNYEDYTEPLEGFDGPWYELQMNKGMTIGRQFIG